MADNDAHLRDWAAPTDGPDLGTSAPPPPPPAPSLAGAPVPPVPPVGAGYAGQPHSAPLTYRSWQPGIVALRPLSFGDFITVPFRAFRFNRAVTLGGPTVMTLLSTALTVLAGWLLFTDPLVAFGSIFTGSDPSAVATGIQPLTVVSLVVAALTWFGTDMMASAIVLVGTSRSVLGERISLSGAWRQMVPRIPQLLVLYLLTGVVWVVLVGVAVAVIVVGAALDSPAVAVVGTLLTVIVAIPVSAVVAVYLPAARGAVLMEGSTAVHGIRRSVGLMKGRFWWTVLILFVTATIVSVVSQIVQTAAQMATFMVIMAAPENEVLLVVVYAVGFGLALIFGNIVIYAFLGAVYGLIYIDARMRREGFDVELARVAEARHFSATRTAG